MAQSALVGCLFDAWDDLDRVVADVSPELAVQALDGSSSFAWTVAHVTHTMDGWLNVRFQGRLPHAVLGQAQYGMGGTGTATDWRTIQRAVGEVRASVRDGLQHRSDGDLALTIAYDGSLVALRAEGISLRYAILRNIAHHYVHIGEIAATRGRLGHAIGVYPGLLPTAR